MPVILADNGVQSRENRAADLTVKKAGDLAMSTIHLFTNPASPSPLSVVGDFTEAVFTGYSAKTVPAWTANEEQLDGSVTTTGTTVLSWVGPVDASGQTIYGYYQLSAGMGTPYIQAVLFPAPVGLVSPTDVLDLVPTFRLP